MKVLITGGAGFIGQRTGQLLLQQGHQVGILDNLSPPAHDGPPALPVGMELIEGDVRRREDWVKALRENEVVIHLADHHDYLPSFSKLFHINAVGTAILFELLLEGKTSVRRVVVGAPLVGYREGKKSYGHDGGGFPPPRRGLRLAWGVLGTPPPLPRRGRPPTISPQRVRPP